MKNKIEQSLDEVDNLIFEYCVYGFCVGAIFGYVLKMFAF